MGMSDPISLSADEALHLYRLADEHSSLVAAWRAQIALEDHWRGCTFCGQSESIGPGCSAVRAEASWTRIRAMQIVTAPSPAPGAPPPLRG